MLLMIDLNDLIYMIVEAFEEILHLCVVVLILKYLVTVLKRGTGGSIAVSY